MKNRLLKIALIGNTNSGKSTFLNTVVGKKISITSKKQNTTIDSIVGILNLKELQIIFYDNPGLVFMKSKSNLNRILRKELWNSIDSSNVILYFLDCSKKTVKIDDILVKNFIHDNKVILIILNKIDLIPKINLMPQIDLINKKYQLQNIFPISSKNKTGISILLKNLKNYAFNDNWVYKKNKKTNKDDIFISNDITRESLLKFLNKEIPYSVKIENSKWKIIRKKNLVINQNIIVNKLVYRKIILGKNGQMIKKIRQYSQKRLSLYFSKDVHLYINIDYKK